MTKKVLSPFVVDESMNNILIKTLCITFIGTVFFCSCKPEDEVLSSKSDIKLLFSIDSIIFDTVFTEQLSVTKRLKVYNPLDNAININEIKLAGLAGSGYSIIINGQQSSYTNNLFLRGKDSILILVSVYLNRKTQILPFLVTDSLVFNTNGSIQSIPLLAWGQNAHYYNGDTLSGNVVWDSTDAKFIYKTIFVPENTTLTIEKGTHIYSRKSQGIVVAGKLIVQGDSGKKVVFAGPRLENYFANIPGQWMGIKFLPKSTGNVIDWAEINNAETGILLGDAKNATDETSLKLTNTIIKNMSGSGVLAYHTNITAWNCLVINCADYGIAGWSGGRYNFYNNTIANYEYTFRRNGVSLTLSNVSDEDNTLSNDIDVLMINNIIWGDNADGELTFQNKSAAQWQSISMKKNLVRSTDAGLISDTANFWNLAPRFLDSTAYDFQVDSLSSVIGKGLKINDFTNDLKGKERGEKFDIGAYQYFPPK